jgi:hypothetical protein
MALPFVFESFSVSGQYINHGTKDEGKTKSPHRWSSER